MFILELTLVCLWGVSRSYKSICRQLDAMVLKYFTFLKDLRPEHKLFLVDYLDYYKSHIWPSKQSDTYIRFIKCLKNLIRRHVNIQ